MFNFTNNTLTDAIDKETAVLSDKVKNKAFTNQLKTSASVFSAFKVHHQTKAMRSLLLDINGDVVPFSKFKKEALKISDHQNKNWLKTEYNTAKRRAAIGVKFVKFKETAHLYPNLKWTPSRSKNPDGNHQNYWGTTLPIDHPFWMSNFPGNRWNCKCGIQRTKAPVTGSNDVPATTQPPKGLDGNPAFTGQIIAKSHPVFKGLSKVEETRIKKEFEVLKLQVPYGKIDYTAKNGSTINIHPHADKFDFETNYNAAKLIAETNKGYNIKITPHVEIKGVKNPEFNINGAISDLKHQFGKNVTSNIKSAIAQNCEIIVYKLDETSKIESAYKLFTRVKGQLSLRRKHPVKRLIIIDKRNKVFFYKLKE